jgi:UDP-N-acetylmuramyl pentapeptide phosphotransferase/UDP-N-acetylglucosamine-1-phosphate transferase
MTIMLIVGSYDDKKSLSPYPKFVIEILLVLLLALLNNGTISSLHGLFGVYHITPWIAWPLTLIACVGIINAINLIDGVDGLSSGMCIMALALFSWIFFISHDWPHAALGCALTGGLIPFFIMNVFGNRSKMFIGDSGTLMLGIAICYMVMTMLKEDSLCKNIIMGNDVSLEAFVLAVLAIPVFDTVRVMFGRIFRGVSPFRPDKTHLHHAFIDYGFHHLETALLEIITNMVIVLTWFVLSFSYLPRELHLLGVAALSILCTFGLYWMLGRKKRISKKGEKVKSEE